MNISNHVVFDLAENEEGVNSIAWNLLAYLIHDRIPEVRIWYGNGDNVDLNFDPETMKKLIREGIEKGWISIS